MEYVFVWRVSLSTIEKSIFGWKAATGHRCQLSDLVVSIDGGELPQGVRESHSAVISLEVQEVPFLPPLLLVNVGLVGEAIQLSVAHCNTQHWLSV